MTPYDRRLNPFINRMAQDMQIRNLAASTIDSYTWHVDKFCSHFGKMPEELGLVVLGPEEIHLCLGGLRFMPRFNRMCSRSLTTSSDRTPARKRFESCIFQRCAMPESQPAQVFPESKSAPAQKLDFAKTCQHAAGLIH